MTKRAKDTIQIFAVIFALVILLRVFVLAFVLVPSRSMMPSILSGDYVFINKLAYSFGCLGMSVDLFEIKKYDVVATNSKLVKRVAGLPGDSLSFSPEDSYFRINKKYYPCFKLDSAKLKIPYQEMEIFTRDINSLHPFYKKAIQQELSADSFSSVLFDSSDTDTGILYSYTFKENYFMLLGDNSEYSRDSRYFGFVPQSEILGKVEFIYFSVDSKLGSIRFDRIGNML